LKDKEPKIVRVESPGKGFWEQVEVDGRSLYVIYNPPTMLKDALNKRLTAQGKDPLPEESLSTELFMPGESGDDFIVNHIPLKRCPWPLSGLPEDPGDELMEEVKVFVMRHVDLPDERLYDVVAAWIFVSWLPEAFNAVPYLWIMGPKSSGKTRLLEVLQCLCYRAMLAAHISDAALFRAIEAFHPTLLLDEASELYNGDNQSSIQNLLNSGYRRGQYVVRVGGIESGEPKLELFDVYGPKAMAGLGGFKETLESRSILILMEKNIRGIEFTVDVDVAKKLRGRLLMWRFRRLSDINAVSDITRREVPRELSFCDGRFAELYTPLILVANDGVEAIVSSAKDAYESVMDEEKTSVEAQILMAILKTRPYLELGKFPTSVVMEKFNEGLTEREKWGNRSIGRLLKRLGFRAKRLTGGSRGWVWEEARIMRLTKRYGTPPVETSLTSLTSLDKALERPLQPSEFTVEATGNGVPVVPPENPLETSLTSLDQAPTSPAENDPSPSLFERVRQVGEALRCAGQRGLGVDDVAKGLGLLSSEAERLLETVQRDGHAFVVPGGRWRWVP
jgi:hypothetical protein